MLLVNGQGGDHHGWDGIRDDFASQYLTIVYDHRGTGQSDKPESPPYSTRGFARDALAILDVELHMVKGGRHLYFVEFREESGQAVLDFLARHRLKP